LPDSSFESAHYNRSIRPAESKRVRNRCAHDSWSRLVGDDVEIQIVICSGEIDVRWKKLMLKRKQTDYGLDGAGGSE
jgi:hypothetical protein